ncbi:hypothetical protein Aperf_G00000078031 [Anoplocephala perfoliata]
MRTRSSSRRTPRSSVSKQIREETKTPREVRSRKSVAKSTTRDKAGQSRNSSRDVVAALPLKEAKVHQKSITGSENQTNANQSIVIVSEEAGTSLRSGTKCSRTKRKKVKAQENESTEHVGDPFRESRKIGAKKMRNSSRNSLKPSSSKRSKTCDETIEIIRDPYELSDDEGEVPSLHSAADRTASSTVAITSPSTRVDTNRKFFITRTEGTTRRPVFKSLEIMQNKLNIKTKHLSKSTTPKPRRQPMTADERARIAATTIWLPIPSQKPQNQEPPSQFKSPLPPVAPPPRQTPRTDSLPPIEESDDFSGCGADDMILTGKPSVQMTNLTDLASPNVSTLPAGPCSTPLNKLIGKAPVKNIDVGGGEGEKVEPLSDLSNIRASTSNPPTPVVSGTKSPSEIRRISFAQPLSPIPKRSSGSRGSSGRSAAELKMQRKNRSQEEEASGHRCPGSSSYEEWLEEFNSQLKPYEDFELTID